MKNIIRGIKKFIVAAILAWYKLLEFLEKKFTDVYIKNCRIKKGKVVFCNMHGKAYGDNPKYIAEECLSRDIKWDMVWLTKEMDISLPKGIRPVRYASQRGRREMASAQFLVDNARGASRPPKRKGQIYLQTWHGGLGLKLTESAVPGLHESYVRSAKLDGANCDGIISSCRLQNEEFRTCFWLGEKTEILEFGLPRNDKLFDLDTVVKNRQLIRECFEIPEGTKIVLYMPTFRDDHDLGGYALDYAGILDAYEKRFGGKFVMLIRLHPNVEAQAAMIQFNDRIKNVTHYPDAQELHMAADYLITDYSSAAFDFALLHKPVFLCTLDLDKYCAERGLAKVYWECPFPRGITNQEFIEAITNFSEEEYWTRMESFVKKWNPFDQGNAAQQAVDWMIKKKHEIEG